MPCYTARKTCIIESPFAENEETGISVKLHQEYLSICLRDSISRGEAPFASHGLYTLPGVLDDLCPEERNTGILCGFQWLDISDMSAAYIDLGITPGMRKGIARAEILGHPVQFRTILTAKQKKYFGAK